MKISLVRHGESEKNIKKIVDSKAHEPFPLTQKGEEQAAQAAAKLASHNAQIVVSSPLLRARQTAQIIATTLGLQLRVDARFNEINNGMYEGKTEHEYRSQLLDGVLDNRHHRTPTGGESFDALKERIASALADLKREGYTHAIVVSHGHPVEAAIRHAKDIAYDEHVPLPGNCDVCEIEI